MYKVILVWCVVTFASPTWNICLPTAARVVKVRIVFGHQLRLGQLNHAAELAFDVDHLVKHGLMLGGRGGCRCRRIGQRLDDDVRPERRIGEAMRDQRGVRRQLGSQIRVVVVGGDAVDGGE